MKEDSNLSFVSAVVTPGTSRSAEPSASTPSSPLLSLLLSSASKPLADAAGSSPVKNAEQTRIASAALIADDIKEVHVCHISSVRLGNLMFTCSYSQRPPRVQCVLDHVDKVCGSRVSSVLDRNSSVTSSLLWLEVRSLFCHLPASNL